MRDFYYSKEGEVSKLKYLNMEGQLGAAYSFSPQRRLSPIVRGGLVVDQAISATLEHLEAYYVGLGTNNIHMAFGFYIGGGADVAIGSNVLRLTAEYKWRRSGFSGLNSSYLALCAGIRL